MTTNYVLRCLEWTNANMSLPVDYRRYEGEKRGDAPPRVLGGVGIGLDGLFSAFNKATPEVAVYMSKSHLVQHVGVESARRVHTGAKQNRFPRTVNFPYLEGYVTLDDDEWW